MKCKYEHDGDCCNAGADQYMCKCKKPCEFIWTLSNADHIRSMSDEELASEIMCPYSIEPDLCNSVKTCNECCLEWLKQPYKEDA